jgi:hypothetical protein
MSIIAVLAFQTEMEIVRPYLAAHLLDPQRAKTCEAL